jgi:NhaP-type Na+/H+ or K+/H+ antiporter
LAIIAAALLTYVLAENLGGNGVLAVTTLGLVFGNIYIEHKKKLQEFSATFSEFLEIFVFVLIGLVISIPLTYNFLIPSLILFLIYILIRFIAIQLSFIKSNITQKEKLFMTLNMPKGIAVAVVAFTLATIPIPGLKPILDLILVFIIYSIILSTIATKFSRYFTKVEIIKKEV